MRVIAIANQKGGVGKTTTAISLAAALAASGKRCLLIDLDSQAHLTSSLGIDPEETELSTYEVLSQSAPLSKAVLSVRDNLWLLPASMDLAGAEQELVAVVGRETILRDALAADEVDYDYVFIDCGPSLGLLTLNSLGAATEVFIPMQPHFLSLQGLSQFLSTVLLVQKRINTELRVTGLLFCMYDSRVSLSGEIVSDIEEFFLGHQEASPWDNVTVFDTRIRRNIKLAECPSHGRTIFEYEPKCHGAADYLALAQEVAAMGNGEVATEEGIDAGPIVMADVELTQAQEGCDQGTKDSEAKSEGFGARDAIEEQGQDI
jgi:chromosome partitioning protein